MESNKNLLLNKAMLWGLIIALASMIVTTIYYSTDNMFSPSAGYITYAVYIAGIVLVTLSYRKSIDQNTPFPYSKALGLGVSTMFFASLILALFTYVLYKFIDQGLIDQMLSFTEEKLLGKGISEDMIEQQIEMQRKFMTPAIMSLSQIFSGVIIGFIISLITSIFLRKKTEDGFNAAMHEIDNEE
jgi:hypothetical protein